MATVTKTFAFAADVEGYAATTASGATGSWDNTIGNPAGSLKMRRTGKNLAAAQSYWEWTGTWQDLGVPVGMVVTAIQLTSGWTRVSEFATAATSTVGPYELRDSAGTTLIGTLWAGRTATGTDAGTAIGTQTAVAVANQDSSTTIKIRLADSLATGSSNSAAISTHDDQVVLDITYSPAFPAYDSVEVYNAGFPYDNLFLKTGSETLSVSLTENRSFGTIAVTASDTLSANVVDTRILNVPVSVSDTLSVSVAESRAFGTVAVVGAEVLNVTLTESNTTKANTTASDTLSVNLTESRSFGTITPSASDTLSVMLTNEFPDFTFPAYRSPTAYTTHNTYNSVITQVSASDTLNASVTESRSFGTVAVVASDSLSAAVTEGVANKVGFSATDSLNASVTETAAIGTVAVPATDTLSASISESVATKVNLSATDTLSGSVTESRSFGTVNVTGVDTLSATLGDTTGTENIRFTSSDVLTAMVNDQRATKAYWTSVDTLSAAATHTAFVAVTTTKTDTLTVSLSDVSATRRRGAYEVYVWNGSAWIEGELYIWNGSAWVAPELYRWNGSAWV